MPVSVLPFFDVLRGVALFGILIVNVFSFGADSTAWAGSPRPRFLDTQAHILRIKILGPLQLIVRHWVLPAEPVARLHVGARGSKAAGSDGVGLPAWSVV